MYIAPKSISAGKLEKDLLKLDKKFATPFDDCGLGEKALYLGGFGVSRICYIPLENVQRVFKRLAVSKGFFEQNKLFGTLCYLVIHFDEGREKVYRFTREEDLDAMLSAFRTQTSIPVGKP